MTNIDQKLQKQIDAIAANPEGDISVYDIGIELMQRGMLYEASRFFHEAIDKNDRAFEACANLGFIYYRMGDSEKLLATNLKAVELEPEYAKGYANLGFMYMEMGRTQEAIAALEKAISLEPEMAQAWSNLTSAHIQQGDLEKAIEAGKKLVVHAPKFAVGFNNLGYAYYLKKDFVKAIIYIDKAQELGLEIHPDFLKQLEPYRYK